MRQALSVAAAALLAALPASAEVRFGPGVRIGGYDVSNQRYRAVQIERVRNLPGPPGCRVIENGLYRRPDGTVIRAPIKQCNLPAKRSQP